ncbi:MAG: hypothetical protein IJB17_00100 [Oscillospiraceae bacterium]|nr:hypothetical protein [Oscillospiraceae bacterium]
MAEKKKKKIVSADDGKEVTAAAKKKTVKEAAPVGNATGLRIGAVVLWVVAIALEVVALLILNGTINWTFMPSLWQIIIALVLDLVCVIIGAQLWKKANRIKPASKKNKFLFWLWNNMGVIVCAFAFIPFVILALTDKKADKKTKTIATVVAIIALLIGGVASYDFDPVSQEDLSAATAAITDNVYWSTFGKVYHTHEDCQALNQSDSLTMGSVEQAIAANRTRLCAFCAKKDEITGVVTDKNPDEVELVDDVQSGDENGEPDETAGEPAA